MDISAGQPPGVVGPVAERNLKTPPYFCLPVAAGVEVWVVVVLVVAAVEVVVLAGVVEVEVVVWVVVPVVVD